MNIFSKINFILTKENASKLTIFFVLMMATVFFEALGVALVFPAVNFIIESDFSTNSKILNKVINFFTENFEQKLLIQFALLSILVTYFLKNLFLFLFLWWQKNFVEFLYRNICERLIEKQLAKSYLEHVESSSAITARNFNEVKSFLKYIENIIILVVEIIVLSIITLILLTVEHKVTLIVFGFVSILIIIFRFFTKKIIKNYGQERFFRAGQMMKTILEILDNYKNIKIYNRDKHFLEKFKKNNYIYSSVNKKFQIIDNSPRFWLEFVGVFGLCIFVFFLLLFDYSNKSVIPILGLFAVAFYRIVPSILRIVRSVQAINFSDPVMETLFSSLQKLKSEKENIQINEITFEKDIKINNLSFEYKNKNKIIFKELNLNISKGKKIGIMGKTGLGKSTLIDVILGFLKPQKGHVLCDNKDIFSNVNGFRNLVGYVPQKLNVINDTIKENIIFGFKDYDQKSADEKLKQSIKISELQDVLDGTKLGLETIIGDKGLNLSGGQLQRIAIARAIYNNPKIIILDEGTNALDIKTENLIIDNLIKLPQKLTIISISHNIESLRYCDEKYELKNFKLNKLNE